MSKKIIERNLPLTDRYTVKSIKRSNLTDADNILICHNCNAEIVNFADIQNNHGKNFTVGLDCMKTLTQAIANLLHYESDLYCFNSALRQYLQIGKAEKTEYSTIDGIDYIDYFLQTKNGLEVKSAIPQTLENYGFDLSEYKIKSDVILQTEKAIENLTLTNNSFVLADNYRIESDNGNKFRLYKNDTLMRILNVFETFTKIKNSLEKC